MNRYRPTPEGIERDAAAVLHILANAHRQLDLMGVDRPNEGTTAGTCWNGHTVTTVKRARKSHVNVSPLRVRERL